MNVLVIDSGISPHPVLDEIDIQTTGYEGQNCQDDVMDYIGHGTAIASLIVKDLNEVKLYVLKLFDELYECDIQKLIDALTYVTKNNIYDIINMSFGIVTFHDSSQITELEKICQLLSKQGSILVAAFDNDGAVSYPAFFDCVIGVETSEKAHKRSEYEYVTNSCVNILAYGLTQKVAWTNPPYTIISGNSFACANTTNVILKLIKSGCDKSNIQYLLRKNAIYERGFEEYLPPAKRPEWMPGMKAIILPFSKEIHSLLAFEDLLDFEIVDVYDFKYSARVGKSVPHLINYRNPKSRVIKNYQDIIWNSPEFDAVICGHMSEMSSICKKDILKDVINQCFIHNKKLYAFDDLNVYNDEITLYEDFAKNVYSPSITYQNIPKGRFGKLHSIQTPVLAVVGTSSSQGKFTVQLALREKLMKSGYRVGHIGSEPTAFCFGMDFVFPYGYNSSTYTSGHFNILLLNQALHEMDMNECDICLVGTQTNTAFYGNNNLENIPLQQLEVLFGTMPDAFILVINAHDDIDYIIRTLKGTEYLIESKCLAIVVSPIMKKQVIGALYKKENIVGTDFYIKFKEQVSKATSIPVLDISEVLYSTFLIDIIIDFFKNS